MGHGGILKSAWDMTRARTQKLVCACCYSRNTVDLMFLSYQRVYFRNLNHPISRPSVLNRRQEVRTDIANARSESTDDKRYGVSCHLSDRGKLSTRLFSIRYCRSHIFDGKTVTKETAAFQLCDLQDPMLKAMIEEEDDLRETCNVRAAQHRSPGVDPISDLRFMKLFFRSATDGSQHTLLSESNWFSVTSSSPCWAGMLLPEKNARRCWCLKRVQTSSRQDRLTGCARATQHGKGCIETRGCSGGLSASSHKRCQ